MRDRPRRCFEIVTKLGDPIIGLLITLVILRITWESWTTISSTEPGEMLEKHEHRQAH